MKTCCFVKFATALLILMIQHPNCALCFVYRIGSLVVRNNKLLINSSTTKHCKSARLWLSSSITTSLQDTVGRERNNEDEQSSTSDVAVNLKKKKNRIRRREFVGLAKAVDRGQFETVYQPIGKNGTFMALSGLPNRNIPFTVLGIESSCDDTGGM